MRSWFTPIFSLIMLLFVRSPLNSSTTQTSHLSEQKQTGTVNSSLTQKIYNCLNSGALDFLPQTPSTSNPDYRIVVLGNHIYLVSNQSIYLVPDAATKARSQPIRTRVPTHPSGEISDLFFSGFDTGETVATVFPLSSSNAHHAESAMASDLYFDTAHLQNARDQLRNTAAIYEDILSQTPDANSFIPRLIHGFKTFSQQQFGADYSYDIYTEGLHEEDKENIRSTISQLLEKATLYDTYLSRALEGQAASQLIHEQKQRSENNRNRLNAFPISLSQGAANTIPSELIHAESLSDLSRYSDLNYFLFQHCKNLL